MTVKVWNLVYQVGNTSRISSDAGNPQRRSSALEGAATIAANGWHVWVEHHVTKERIFDSKPAAKSASAGAASAPVDWRNLAKGLLDAGDDWVRIEAEFYLVGRAPKYDARRAKAKRVLAAAQNAVRRALSADLAATPPSKSM